MMLLGIALALIILTIIYFNLTPTIEDINTKTENMVSKSVAETISKVEFVKTSKDAALLITELSQNLIQVHECLSLTSTVHRNHKFTRIHVKREQSGNIFDAMEILCSKINTLEDTATAMKPWHNVFKESKLTNFYVGKILDIMNQLVSNNVLRALSKVKSAVTSEAATSLLTELCYTFIQVQKFVSLTSEADPNNIIKWNNLWEQKSKEIFAKMEILCNQVNTPQDIATAMKSLCDIANEYSFNEYHVKQILELLNHLKIASNDV